MNHSKIIKQDILTVEQTIINLKKLVAIDPMYQEFLEESYRDLYYLRNLLKYGIQRVEKQGEAERVGICQDAVKDGGEWWGESVWGR